METRCSRQVPRSQPQPTQTAFWQATPPAEDQSDGYYCSWRAPRRLRVRRRTVGCPRARVIAIVPVRHGGSLLSPPNPFVRESANRSRWFSFLPQGPYIPALTAHVSAPLGVLSMTVFASNVVNEAIDPSPESACASLR